MKICNASYTFMGETGLMIPCVLLRLSGCNLKERCAVDCDTKEAWEGGNELTLDDLSEIVEGANNILITGGEPLLQRDNVFVFANRMKSQFKKVYLETNGTIPITPLEATVFERIVVSPKGAIDFEAWRVIPNVIFKPVVKHEGEVSYWARLLGDNRISKERIWYMPYGKTAREVKHSFDSISEECRENNYIVVPRMQIVWGFE